MRQWIAPAAIAAAGGVAAVAGLAPAATPGDAETAATTRAAANMTGRQVVPAQRTRARGTARFSMDSRRRGTIRYSIRARGLHGSARHVQLRQGRRGRNGPVVLRLVRNSRGFVALPKSGSWIQRDIECCYDTMPDVIRAMRRGDLYFQIYTATYGNGEIRGQTKASR